MITAEESQVMALAQTVDNTDDYEYLSDKLDRMVNLDIIDFDIENFESYLTDIPDATFEDVWDLYLKPALLEIENRWIYLDSEKFDFIDSTKAKRNLFIVIMIFLMDFFPFDIVNKYIVPPDLNTLADTRKWVDDHEDELKDTIIDALEQEQERYSKVITVLEASVEEIKKAPKRQKYQDRLTYIRKNVNKKIKYMQYFIFCVKETPIDSLKDTIVHYVSQIRGEV